MILPLDYVRSYEEKTKENRRIHSDKILKSRIKTLLPNQTTLKLFFNQNGKSVHESKLLQFYHFDGIERSEYQKILSNPLYFLENQRNVRIFKFYLQKNGLFQRLEGKSPKLKQRRKSSQGEDYIPFDCQFLDKTKVNYQEPWTFIQKTIQRLQSQTGKRSNVQVAANLNERHSVSQGKLSLKSQKNLNYQSLKEKHQNPEHYFSQTKLIEPPQPVTDSSELNLTKSVQKNTSSLRHSPHKKSATQDQPNEYSKIDYFNKLLQSDMRIKKIKETQSIQRQKRLFLHEVRTQTCSMRRSDDEKNYSSIKKYDEQLRRKCLSTVNMRSLVRKESKVGEKQVKLESKGKNVPTLLSCMNEFRLARKKLRNQKLKKILQKRLGIEEEQQCKPKEITHK